MRATFVDHRPPAWQAFCSKFYAELLGLRQGNLNNWQTKAVIPPGKSDFLSLRERIEVRVNGIGLNIITTLARHAKR
jgi:hypothetical protein